MKNGPPPQQNIGGMQQNFQPNGGYQGQGSNGQPLPNGQQQQQQQPQISLSALGINGIQQLPNILKANIALLNAMKNQNQMRTMPQGAPPHQQVARPTLPGGIGIPQPRHPPPPPKEPKPAPPKADVVIRSLPLEHHIQQCCLNRSFIDRRVQVEKMFSDKFQVSFHFTDNAIMLLATALKARMMYVVKECVWYCKLRRQQTFPPERLIIDVPRARFSLLEAEREIVANKELIIKEQKANPDVTLDRLKNEALQSITSQTPIKQREMIPQTTNEADDDAPQNFSRINELSMPINQPETVTQEDVNAFIENDMFLSASQYRRSFAMQNFKI
ncbi:hypothetical protein GPJ56_000624 [Histomonas meleagridis]|uniref:uncharacterized protein n=1 Tax=Histomonas meleagridis TaxID=135588 RepID=UPI00355ABD55|nr:hypothetical protein GPJ56_000624 [Histomonas meleagridis]KAH0804751.1 hypothetical protein GO595_002445 [Histomonas meleagridis]